MITWNPNDRNKSGAITLGNDNLTFNHSWSVSVYHGIRATEGKISGKWYYEITIHSSGTFVIAVANKQTDLYHYEMSGISKTAVCYNDINKDDIIGIALNFKDNNVNFYKNNQLVSRKSIAGIVSENGVFPAIFGSGSTKKSATANFGATKFDIVTSNPEEWGRLTNEGYLPYDYESANISWWGADIANISISKTNMWHTDKDNINLSCSVTHPDNKDIKYETLVNNIKAIASDNFISAPADINIEIPNSAFTEEENLLELIVIDSSGGRTSFKYNIIKENRDTFTFNRIFDFKEDYITDENIEVIYGRGLTLKEIGRGEVNIEIPTEGKSKISNIVIEGGEDKEEELTIEREMTYLNDLGEGKVYESRLLTEYNDITDARTSRNANLTKSNNKYYTYQNNEFVEVEPTIENFKNNSIGLSQLTTPTNKVILTMDGGEVLEDGKLYRKTIDISKYKDIERIEVK